ncbi:MAG: hypothetical protein HQ507_04085 [Candidatus Marinimicrobia bacterium]|nr:hypothetical protein [Candidatus Neomarinimicrobiota bacterium]
MNKLAVTLLISALFLGSCSTMSFIPTEGGAAKFNLATVGYVQAQAEAQKAELIENLASNMSSVLDSLLQEDRAELIKLSAQLDSLDAALLVFSAQIDSAELRTEQSLVTMSKELTTVKTNASSTRMVIRRINDNIDNLPVKTLETFNEAINAYLNKEEAPTE